jgi:multiple sugar transport system permease protein
MVVKQSCIFALTAVFFKALLGFIVAHLVHAIPAKGQRKWRGMLLVPWVIPPALSTLAWLWLFDPSYSAFNYSLATLGIGPIPWTGDEVWARFSVILVNIWVGAPFFMIMYLAALKSVPEQLYAAAAIDGANAVQTFFRVVFPAMRPINIVIVVITIIESLRAFDVVYVINRGTNGLELLSALVIQNLVGEGQVIGVGSALAVVLLVISLVPIVFYLSRTFGRENRA